MCVCKCSRSLLINQVQKSVCKARYMETVNTYVDVDDSTVSSSFFTLPGVLTFKHHTCRRKDIAIILYIGNDTCN